MIRISAVPYRQPPGDAINADPWQLASSAGVEPLPGMLPHWDYHTDMLLNRSLTIDLAAVRRHCGLENVSSLRVVALWTSPGTALRASFASIDCPPDSSERAFLLEGTIRGIEVSATIRIETQLLLADPYTSTASLTPTRAGSILWRDRQEVAVEGRAARFPMEAVDFENVLGVPEDSAFHLAWNPLELHGPYLGSVRLLVNTRHPAVVEAVIQAAPDKAAAAVRSAIYFEVGRALVRGALLNEEFIEDHRRFTEGTTGRALSRLFMGLFPGDAPLGVKNTMHERPDHFDSVLQSRLRLFRE